MDLTRIKSIQTINLVLHKMVLILTTFTIFIDFVPAFNVIVILARN